MSLQLSTLGVSLPTSVQNRNTINHFAASCNTKFTQYNTWGSYAAAAVKKDNVQSTVVCSKLSGEEDVNLYRGSKEDELRTKFVEVYSVLKSELLNDPAFEWTHDSRQWVQQMVDYNVPTGKLTRGLTVTNSYKLLKEGKELTEDEVFDASVLGWCIEWLQAFFLMHDDIMDNSHTRRRRPCWYRVPEVGKAAVNDAVLLMTQVSRILKKHFGEKPYYTDLLDLFNEVMFQTVSGQMVDVIITAGERDLSNYTLHNYRLIAEYKCGYFSCYLPVACALLLAGENLEKHIDVKQVLLDMGIYYQIGNDYLDCFGDPKKTGKIGTDIEDFKCSWLVVKALELANEEQKKIIHEHYGKANPSDVAKVKGVYNEINLQGVFAEYESETHDKLKTYVEENKTLDGIWAIFAIYRTMF